MGLILTLLSNGWVLAAEPPPVPSTSAPAVASADLAAQVVRGQTGGRVLDVRPVPAVDGGSWEVRVLLDEGRVRRIRVDTGTVPPR